MIAGLPVDYFMQQVKDMRTRARHSGSPVPFPSAILMQQIADSVTDAELQVVAEYFSHVRARRASKVLEADSVPKTMPLNGLSTLVPGNEREALNGRLIELPLELRRHELHDPMAEYVAYVPRGSLARGRALAVGDPAHGVKGCTSCHGPALRGVGLVPPLAGRLIELPLELRRHELHDPMAEYVAYVPRGSIARGRALAMGDAAHGVKGCTSCHGPSLRGVGLVPPLAGRSPSYILRQLVGFRTGARATPASAPMQEVVARLSIEDMVAAAAFAGSRRP